MLRTEPWRYGFHATPAAAAYRCRPPEVDLLATLRQLAQQHASLSCRLCRWTGCCFLCAAAVQAIAPEHPAQQLADAAIKVGCAPRPAHRVRRAPALPQPGLNAAQREHVLRWGYAHAFEHWRLHFTLTDRLDACLRELDAPAQACHGRHSLRRPRHAPAASGLARFHRARARSAPLC